MRINLLHSIKKRIKFKITRNSIRGFYNLESNSQLRDIKFITHVLSTSKFNLSSKSFSKYIFGNAKINAELVLRQFMAASFLYNGVDSLGIQQSIFISKSKKGKKIIYPLPKHWQFLLSDNGYDINKILSSILWFFYILKSFYKGVRTFFNLYTNTFKSVFKIPQKSIFFVDINKKCLPFIFNGNQSKDIVSWYYNKFVNKKEINVIFHNNIYNSDIKIDSLIVKSGNLFDINGFTIKKNIFFLFSSIRILIVAFIDIFRGRWWSALLLSDVIYAQLFKIIPKEAISNEYLFSNSSWIYRPLWTYEAEKFGSKIILYFYSTNIEDFQINNKYEEYIKNFSLINWPNYIVWDKYQLNFIERAAVKNCKKNILTLNSHIHFSDFPGSLPVNTKKVISIFDITPFRLSRLIQLSEIDQYYTCKIIIQFLEDIKIICEKYGYIIYYKGKRSTNLNIFDKKYINWINNSISSNFIAINPDISAIRVIEASNASISIPFTSTALIGSNLGKPSVYYDPTDKIEKNDRASHGIEIISGKMELDNWVKTL
jgi:polysaccharide biosynthesis PFTS motif protein